VRKAAEATWDLNPDRVELLTEIPVYDPRICSIAGRLRHELKTADRGHRMCASGLAVELAIALMRNYSSVKPPKSAARLTEQQVARAKDYIRDNLLDSRVLTLTRAAKACDVSYYQLSHSFKPITGMSFRRYINSQRIERAKGLLNSQPAIDVLVLARKCGFDDAGYFDRVFRDHTGTTPTAYWRSTR
jgi:AraC-like DNA-binding protein